MKMKLNLIISVILMFISSFSLIIIPFSDFNGITIQKVLAYVIGAVFWLFLVAAWTIQIILSKQIKSDSKKFGLISFFSNKIAIAADIIALISLVATILMTIISGEVVIPEIVSYLIISVFFFSLQMHCVCNGKIFKHILKISSNGGEIQNEK